jgi:hypothetical protein
MRAVLIADSWLRLLSEFVAGATDWTEVCVRIDSMVDSPDGRDVLKAILLRAALCVNNANPIEGPENGGGSCKPDVLRGVPPLPWPIDPLEWMRRQEQDQGGDG